MAQWDPLARMESTAALAHQVLKVSPVKVVLQGHQGDWVFLESLLGPGDEASPARVDQLDSQEEGDFRERVR